MVATKGKDWVLAASLLLLVRTFDGLYPNRDHGSDGSIGNAEHASRESDHNPFDGFVHAVDIDEDLAPGLDLKAFAEALRLSRDQRIRYVIYEGRIFKSYRDPKTGAAAWTWIRYTGPSPHEGHLHISIDRTATARDDLRPWPQPPTTEDDMYTNEDRARDDSAAYATVNLILPAVGRIEQKLASNPGVVSPADLEKIKQVVETVNTSISTDQIKDAVKAANREGTG